MDTAPMPNAHVIWKRPGEEPVITEIDPDSVEDLQRLTGGYFEAFTLRPPDIVIWWDEDGMMKRDAEPNVRVGDTTIVGPVVITKRLGPDITDMPPLDAAEWMSWLREQAV